MLHDKLTGDKKPHGEEDHDRCDDGQRALPRVATRATEEAIYVRDTFKEYFNNVSPVSWQRSHVRRGLEAVE